MATIKHKLSRITLSTSLAIFSMVSTSTAFADSTTSSNSARENALFRNSFSAPLHSIGNVDAEPGFITLLGAKVTGLNSCDGDIGLTITNAFTDGTLKKMYENFSSVISTVMSTGGAIYLAGLYLQKSNQGLYSLLTNGINLGLDDYLSGISSCKSMLNAVANSTMSGVEGDKEGSWLNSALKNDDGSFLDLSEVDIVDFLSAEPNDEDQSLIGQMKKGLPWYDDDGVESTAGGEDSESPVISWVKTGAAVGYCILRGIDTSNCNADGAHQESSTSDKDIEEDPMWTILFGTDEEKYMANFQTLGQTIFGEKYSTTCDSCETSISPGTGLKRWYELEAQTVYGLITTRVNSALSTMTTENIKAMSAPYSLYISKPYIQALKSVSDREEVQDILMKSLAAEVAYYRTLYVADLYSRAWLAMTKDQKTQDAKYSPEYEKLHNEVNNELSMFLQYMTATGFEPGKYSRSVLQIGEANGNYDAILNTIKLGN